VSAAGVWRFRVWLKLGYCVKRGERALRIWVPIPPSRSAIEEWERNGAIADERPRTPLFSSPAIAIQARSRL
jgi:hypothetical protein